MLFTSRYLQNGDYSKVKAWLLPQSVEKFGQPPLQADPTQVIPSNEGVFAFEDPSQWEPFDFEEQQATTSRVKSYCAASCSGACPPRYHQPNARGQKEHKSEQLEEATGLLLQGPIHQIAHHSAGSYPCQRELPKFQQFKMRGLDVETQLAAAQTEHSDPFASNSGQQGRRLPDSLNDAQQGNKRIALAGSVRIAPDGSVDFQLPSTAGLSETLSKFPEMRQLPGSQVWRCPVESYEKVLKMLQRMNGVRIEGLHSIPLQTLQATGKARDESERFQRIPESLRESLMVFQREGVKFALKKGTRVLLGDEMGLGKTVQALALLAAQKDVWPALIICPSSLREQWADAVNQWLGLTESRLVIVNSGADVSLVQNAFATSSKPSRDFLIISYNFVSKMKDVLGKANFQFVVLDESHYIKDAKTQRAKDTIPLVQKAKYAVLLSGTPIISRPKEMFTQLSALLPQAKLSMRGFGERYCHSPNNPFSKYDGCTNSEELNKLLTSTLMIRRLKRDVLSQLPPKRRQQVFLRLAGPEQEKLTKQTAAMEAARSLLIAGDASMAQEQRSLVMEAYRLTAELKVKVVQQYVEDLVDSDQKFLIFCHHKVMNDGIAEVLNKKKVQHICIDGSVPAEKRQGLVNKFQLNNAVRVALLSIKAAGVGLTLTAASLVVFAELAWTPGEIVQAEDRAHRIGQPSSVNIHFLHVKQSVDDIMWALIQSKLVNVGQTMDGRKESLHLEKNATSARDPNQGSLLPFFQTGSVGDASL